MKYKVFRTDFLNLEYNLNKWYQDFPNYHLYQILSETYYNSTLVVVIFEHDDLKGGVSVEQAD